MRRFLFSAAALLVFPLTAAASKPAVPYQDAVLVSFTTVADGQSCSSTPVYAPSNNNTQPPSQVSSVQTACSDSQTRRYTLRVGEQSYVVEPDTTGKESARNAALIIGTIGYGALFVHQHDVLANQLPGAHILIRSAGNGFRVKVGKKESYYSATAMEASR